MSDFSSEDCEDARQMELTEDRVQRILVLEVCKRNVACVP